MKIVGDSMDLEAPDGAYAVCVNWADTGLEMKPGMIVHVERVRPDQSETTLKAVERENGHFILVPRSRNPAYKPISYEQVKGEQVVIRGAVISFYRRNML